LKNLERMMAKIEPFEKHASEYEAWFEKYKFVYESELRAIEEQIPKKATARDHSWWSRH
jgi:hypothetical protein